VGGQSVIHTLVVLGVLDLTSFVHGHCNSKATVSLVAARPRDEKDYGVVSIDDNGFVGGFNEKPANVSGNDHYLSAGVYCFDRCMFDTMPSIGEPFSLETDLFPKLVGNGMIAAHKVDGHVQDIGTPARYKAAQTKRFSFE
jgi:NDP-sugar pyrophosphorylase family protein